jgi:hypothetical protein
LGDEITVPRCLIVLKLCGVHRLAIDGDLVPARGSDFQKFGGFVHGREADIDQQLFIALCRREPCK